MADLPPPAPAFIDGIEQALATLDADSRTALVRAHDAGVRAGGLAGSAAATRALLALAQSSAPVPPGGERGAEWMLGLLPASDAEAVSAALGDAGGEFVRALRRGRRRLEGLPPASRMASPPGSVVPPPRTQPAGSVGLAPAPVGLARR